MVARYHHLVGGFRVLAVCLGELVSREYKAVRFVRIELFCVGAYRDILERDSVIVRAARGIHGDNVAVFIAERGEIGFRKLRIAVTVVLMVEHAVAIHLSSDLIALAEREMCVIRRNERFRRDVMLVEQHDRRHQSEHDESHDREQYRKYKPHGLGFKSARADLDRVTERQVRAYQLLRLVLLGHGLFLDVLELADVHLGTLLLKVVYLFARGRNNGSAARLAQKARYLFKFVVGNVSAVLDAHGVRAEKLQVFIQLGIVAARHVGKYLTVL